MRVSVFWVSLVVLLAIAGGNPASAAAKGCMHGHGRVSKKLTGGFEIRISPNRDKVDLDDPECRAVVLDVNRKTIFAENDWGFSIEVAGSDVNGDGIPDVVLEAYSGGAHCCWTYYVISLGSKPGLIAKFENNRDAAFFWDDGDRRIEILTRDGNFDYFDGLCHGCTPFPLVYLRLDGTTLVDISPSCVDDYDEIISQNQKALTAPDFQHLRALKENPSDDEESRETIYKALTIVFAYLYSGREVQARQALQNMWPAFDQERMWKLIEETRRDGILRYTRKQPQ